MPIRSKRGTPGTLDMAHIGVDRDSGLVHTVEATAANVHDVAEVPKLLTGKEEAVYGDSGYLGAGKREDAVVRNKSGRKIKYKGWKENSIDFRIYLYLDDMKIIGGHVFKYRELSQSEHYRPTGYETDPTQQELRIVKRLLSYISEEE